MDITADQLTTTGALLLDFLLLIIAPVLVFLVHSLVKKWGNSLTEQQRLTLQATLSEIVSQGVSRAEHWANQRIKEGSSAPTGQNKLFVATKYILDRLEEAGIPDVTEEAIKERIESHLGLLSMESPQIPSWAMMQEDQEDEDEGIS